MRLYSLITEAENNLFPFQRQRIKCTVQATKLELSVVKVFEIVGFS